jgi:hypothetical protein
MPTLQTFHSHALVLATGPTWESVDGSKAVAQAVSVQRLKTVGGIASTERCDAANARQVARVPYTATYYFNRVGP